MKQTILEVAKKWRTDKPLEGKEIISQIIDTAATEIIEEQNKELRLNNKELTRVCERLETEKNSVDEKT